MDNLAPSVVNGATFRRRWWRLGSVAGPTRAWRRSSDGFVGGGERMDPRVLLVDLNNFARYPTLTVGLLVASPAARGHRGRGAVPAPPRRPAGRPGRGRKGSGTTSSAGSTSRRTRSSWDLTMRCGRDGPSGQGQAHPAVIEEASTGDGRASGRCPPALGVPRPAPDGRRARRAGRFEGRSDAGGRSGVEPPGHGRGLAQDPRDGRDRRCRGRSLAARDGPRCRRRRRSEPVPRHGGAGRWAGGRADSLAGRSTACRSRTSATSPGTATRSGSCR